jgi:transcriptional regulator with XRE-family HTH domain
METFCDPPTLPTMAQKEVRPDSVAAISSRLRALRLSSGLPQNRFAETASITPPAWNNYEKGTSRISLDAALKLCGVTGASLDWIYRGIESTLPVSLAERLRKSAKLEGSKGGQPNDDGTARRSSLS